MSFPFGQSKEAVADYVMRLSSPSADSFDFFSSQLCNSWRVGKCEERMPLHTVALGVALAPTAIQTFISHVGRISSVLLLLLYMYLWTTGTGVFTD